MITLSSAIKNKINLSTNWFEPVFDLKIWRKMYSFWIPFRLICWWKKRKVAFWTDWLKWLFNHFNTLSWRNLSVSWAYNEILENKKIINKGKDLKIISNIIQLKEKYLLENWYLKLKKEIVSWKIEENNDFNLDIWNNDISVKKEEVKNIKEKYSIKDLKAKTLEDLEENCKAFWFKKIENWNKTYYITLLSKLALKEKELNRKLTKEEKTFLEKELKNFLNQFN